MPKNISIATIDSPEFINITGISPFVSKCECKVFYLGHNRNGSHIDKTVAVQMAQTLPGCPVVGYYSEQKEDFRDHGELVTIDGDGVKFKCQTTPYGFVAPDAKVWFKDFEDQDEFGNKVVRTYLMTECYLWTGQFEEAMKVYNEGRPHSMELDSKTLKGFWSTDNNCGMDFFIINDAIFSKLCILGEDVEPCFEGSSITSPKVSSSFTVDSNFKNTLYSMMEELKELTNSTLEKGESQMDTEKEFVNVQDAVVNPESQPAEASSVAEENTLEVEAPVEEVIAEKVPEEEISKISEIEDNLSSEINSENQNTVEEFKKKEDSEEDKNSSDDSDSDSKSDDETDKEEDKQDNSDEDEKKKVPTKNTLEEVEEKYSLLEQQYNELQEKFTALEEQNKELKEFKLKVEDQEKDNLINSFYMLSDEDKKNVIENKANYTLDDIKKELSVICVDKKVTFTKEDKKDKEIETPTIFNLNDSVNSDLPAWLKAVEERKNNV